MDFLYHSLSNNEASFEADAIALFLEKHQFVGRFRPLVLLRVGLYTDRSEQKNLSISLCPPQTPCGFAQNRTWDAAVRYRKEDAHVIYYTHTHTYRISVPRNSKHTSQFPLQTPAG